MDPANTEGIPLKCNLCPKEPLFSDVSHLLTHVFSKSHLSYKFKIELLAEKDAAARAKIAQYDTWCEKYGIQGLLAERIAAKEKRTAKRTRPSDRNESSGAARKRGKGIKTEANDDKDDPEVEQENYPEPGLGHHPRRPAVGNWNTPNQNGHPHMHGQPNEYVVNGPSYEATGLSRVGPDNNQSPPVSNSWNPDVEATGSAPSEAAADNKGTDRSTRLKLKGVQWPGMDIFDSAPEAKQKLRNQRKDESVLILMEQSSVGVEPTEMVWTKDGALHKRRDIYDSPSLEGSPEPISEAGSSRKKKVAHRATAVVPASEPRKTRASTKKAQAKDDSKVMEGGIAAVNGQMAEGPHGFGPAAMQINAGNGYGAFRDPFHMGLGHPDHFSNTGSNLLSPALASTPDGLTESPSKGGSVNVGRRPALKPMDSNMPIASSSSMSIKPQSIQQPQYHVPLSPHLSPFFHHQNGAHNALNPLSFQNQQGYNFNSFINQGFGDNVDRETAGFRSVATQGGIGYDPQGFGDDIKFEGNGFNPNPSMNGTVYDPFMEFIDNNPFNPPPAGHQDFDDFGI